MKENFYHGLLLGLLRSQGNWLIKSNAETGEGYSDISIQTSDRVGIVIELKYANDGNLESACRVALEQIEEKKIYRIPETPENAEDYQVRNRFLRKRMYRGAGIVAGMKVAGSPTFCLYYCTRL